MPAKKTTAKTAKPRKPAARKPAARSASRHRSTAAKTEAKSKAVAKKSATPKVAAARGVASKTAAAKAGGQKRTAPKATPASKAPAASKSPPAGRTSPPAASHATTPPVPAAEKQSPAAPVAPKQPNAAVVARDPSKVATAVATVPAGGLAPGAFVDEDDGDAPSRHNLLLGPRNVKPYVIRKGEEYMNREQTEHFRSILLNWKRDLMEEVDRTVTHMKDGAANPPDPNDRATLESEFALELRTRDRERKLIRKIEEALKRLDDGSYGYCMETGEPIGVKRLEARPVATLSIEAQERRERREKQYGDRDDWYR